MVKIGSEIVKIDQIRRICQNVLECAHMWWNEQFSICRLLTQSFIIIRQTVLPVFANLLNRLVVFH